MNLVFCCCHKPLGPHLLSANMKDTTKQSNNDQDCLLERIHSSWPAHKKTARIGGTNSGRNRRNPSNPRPELFFQPSRSFCHCLLSWTVQVKTNYLMMLMLLKEHGALNRWVSSRTLCWPWQVDKQLSGSTFVCEKHLLVSQPRKHHQFVLFALMYPTLCDVTAPNSLAFKLLGL